MTNNKEGKLVLHAEGSAFKDGQYDLRTVESIITNYRRTLDATVPFAFKHKTLTRKIKHNLTYRTSFQEGSIEIVIDFLIQNSDAIAVIGASDGGIQIAQKTGQLINSILKFRRIYNDLLENGIKPKIKINFGTDNSKNYDLSNIRTDGGDIYINPTIIPYTISSQTPINKLIKSIDGEKLTDITIQSKNTATKITQDDIRITGTQKEELPKNIEIVGRLDVVAFSSHRGKLILQEKTYRVTWHEEIRKKIHDFADMDDITYLVKPVVDYKRLTDDPVMFHIVNCWEDQQRLI